MRALPTQAFTKAAAILAMGIAAASCSNETTPELAVRGTPKPVPSPGAVEIPPPNGAAEVHYTISRGASLRRIANLYKLDHAEIFALNPDLSRDQELAPDTDVVVYRKGDEASESVGVPHDGQLVGGMPMLEGPGRRLTSERWKMWGSRRTVTMLDRVLVEWARVQPEGPEVLVGNLSTRKGGVLAPHKTHQSGRDVDLSYIAKWDGRSRVNWQQMNAQNLDARLTWKLLRLLVSEADVEVFYIDRSLQEELLSYAQKSKRMSDVDLQEWLEVAPGAKRRGTLIRHVAGHRDHFHVRFRCPPQERRCRS
jgi:murein endopeptidase